MRTSAVDPVKFFLKSFVFAACTVLYACSGGGGSGASAPPAAPGVLPPVESPTPLSGPANVTLSIASGTLQLAAHQRSPKYLPTYAVSLHVQVLEVNGAAPSPAPTPFTYAGSNCPIAGGSRTCTISLALPVGNDLVEVTSATCANATCFGLSGILSQYVGALNVTAQGPNTFGTASAPLIMDFAPSFAAGNGLWVSAQRRKRHVSEFRPHGCGVAGVFDPNLR